MALANRLAESQPNRSNRRGCETCIWLRTLSVDDKASFMAWVKNGHSLMQLHDICTTDPENPLRVSFTALRNHIKAGHSIDDQ